MSIKQRIILGHFHNGKSVRFLSRELGVHRATVKKYIEEQRLLLDRQGISDNISVLDPPKYERSISKSRVLTSVVLAYLDELIQKNKDHQQAGRKKQCLKMIDMYEALIARGHKVSYTSVRRYVNGMNSKGQEVYIKQEYVAGQSVEFDWGEVKLMINGRQVKKMLAVFTSSYSNHRWSMVFDRQDMSSFLEAHVQYFKSVGAVTGLMTYDNMRTAVAQFACRNKDKVATNDLLKLSTYYGFDIRFCNARSGHEKGHVERTVEYVRRKAFSLNVEFKDIKDANEHLWATCLELNQKPVQGQKVSIEKRFEEELLVMSAVPPVAYDCAIVRLQKATKLSCVSVDKNHYSVPEKYVGQVVEVRLYANRIAFFDPKTNEKLAIHSRQYTDNEYFIEINHFLSTLQKKPGALLDSLAWKQATEVLHGIHKNFFKGQERDFIAILLWCREQEFEYELLQQVLVKRAADSPNLVINIDEIKIRISATRKIENHSPDRVSSLTHQAIQAHSKQQLAAAQSLFHSYSQT